MAPPEVATLTVTHLQDVVAVADAVVVAAEEVAVAVAALRSARWLLPSNKHWASGNTGAARNALHYRDLDGALVRHVTFDTHVLL